MSIYFSGSRTKSAGIISAINKQLKSVNLKHVKKIQVQFDPFHQNAITARDFLYYISTPKVLNTNISCIVKPNVVCDRSEPEIKIDLADTSIVKFKANNLNCLEILQLINKHISSKVEPEEEVSNQTKKLEKKRLKKK